MEVVEFAIPAVVVVQKLMGSEVLVGARVCSTDGEGRESDAGFTSPGPKIHEFNSLSSHRGTPDISQLSSWTKKADIESCRSNGMLSRLATEDMSKGLEHGITSSSVALVSLSEGKQTQRKVGKIPRNGNGSYKKLQMLQTGNLLPQTEADDVKMESDKLGTQLVKCSNADKSSAVKQKSSVNGRRGDRRNYKVQMKAKYDPFSPKAGLPSFSPAGGGSNAFGMYGLKPDIHDVTKLIDDISLDELLDGSYKYPTQVKDKGKKAANVNENILDSVRKACSIFRLQGIQEGKQTEELDIHVNKEITLVSSPSRTGAANGSDGDESSLITGLSKCSKDQESCIKAEAPTDTIDNPLYQPKDVLERLALPPPKDLDSLLQEAVKQTSSGKLTDSRSGKPLSHRVTLPPFSWSNNFNGHYKSNNDSIRISNKSTCHGRWVRIRSTACFTGGGGNEAFMDLKSLTYDDSLVPAGQLKYRFPEIGKTSCTFVSQGCCQQDLSSAVCSTPFLPPRALHSPSILAAAQTLCDIATHCMKHNLNITMKWPKQPSQKAMKARKSRFIEKTEEDIPTPKSETILDHVVRGVEYASSSKKPKISVVQRREDFSHVQAVIGLSSVSAPRSSRSDSVAETRHCNGSFMKPSFMIPLPPRVLDRSNHNPQKVRKLGPMDWNRSRS